VVELVAPAVAAVDILAWVGLAVAAAVGTPE